MNKVIVSFISGIIITIMLLWKRAKGVTIEPEQVAKIKKEINDKPIADIVSTLNDWLS